MDDKLKIQAAIIAFGVVVMIYQVFFNFGDDFDWLKLPIAFILGAVAGGIAFVVTSVMRK